MRRWVACAVGSGRVAGRRYASGGAKLDWTEEWDLSVKPAVPADRYKPGGSGASAVVTEDPLDVLLGAVVKKIEDAPGVPAAAPASAPAAARGQHAWPVDVDAEQTRMMNSLRRDVAAQQAANQELLDQVKADREQHAAAMREVQKTMAAAAAAVAAAPPQAAPPAPAPAPAAPAKAAPAKRKRKRRSAPRRGAAPPVHNYPPTVTHVTHVHHHYYYPVGEAARAPQAAGEAAVGSAAPVPPVMPPPPPPPPVAPVEPKAPSPPPRSAPSARHGGTIPGLVEALLLRFEVAKEAVYTPEFDALTAGLNSEYEAMVRKAAQLDLTDAEAAAVKRLKAGWRDYLADVSLA
eukprot:TRINITY_DN2107_c0_g1_i2.p1 TRINITY_DN2107_c0_g1~~TRINITY_DN2107_c0_g1_i2.p1  ORF type:complete len:348 (+),score=94.66 TRINITY_DN2107_c0_g1_i2:39-1082(+)